MNMTKFFRELAFRIETTDPAAFAPEANVKPITVMLHQNASFVLFTQENCFKPYNTVSRGGDLFVGLYNDSDADVHVTVEIGGQDVTSYVVRAGGFAYAMDDASVVPLVCLRFHEVKIKAAKPLKVVLALICPLELRRYLCQNYCYARRGSEFMTYSSGMGVVVDKAPTTAPTAPTFNKLPNMRHVPHVFDDFLAQNVVADLLRLTDHADGARPSLQLQPDVIAKVQRELNATCFEIVGDRITVGNTDAGIHEHRDESYQTGGEKSLLVYLTNVGDGGDTVFVEDGIRVHPVAGRAVLFDVRALHRADPVSEGQHKRIIAFEVRGRPTTKP